MKKIAIILIDLYQIFLSPFLKVLFGSSKFCRFEETCSAYTKRVVLEKGVMKGVWLGLLRLSKCQPFYTAKL